MTPLERAARALHQLYTDEKVRSGAKDMPTWDQLGEDGRFYFTHRARAVLQALREPSERMLNAGYGECHHPKDIPEHIWREMIDAAMEEGPLPEVVEVPRMRLGWQKD